MLVVSVATLTIIFVALYYVLTHQILYFGSNLVLVSPSTIITIYILLLAGIILRGKIGFLRPFPVALALYLIADTVIFNVQRYYPVTFNTYYLLALLVGIAIVVSDLPKRHITSFVGFLIAAFSAYMLLVSYQSFIALVISIVLAYMALTSLASGLEGEIAKGVAASRTYIVLALAAITILEFLKPYLHGGLFDVAEWVVFAFAALASVRKVKIDYDKKTLAPHKQLIAERFDELVLNLDKAVENFILTGEKSLLVSSIAKALFDAGYNEREVAKILSPIVFYSDEKPPALSLPWERKLIERRNMDRRKKVLKSILKFLKNKNLNKTFKEFEEG